MLLDDVINQLSDEKSSIYDALLKTKILLHQLGKKDLIGWVNNELNGYPNDAELPPYRIVHSLVLADFANVAWRFSSHPIPLAHLRDDQRERLEKSKLNESLALLEDLVSKEKGSLVQNLPMEMNAVLGQSLGSGFRINRAWCEINIAEVKNISAQVRSRLLDFLLELRDNIGESATDANLKEAAKAVDTAGMFNRAIFGSHTMIIVGNKNQQSVQITNSQGDLSALSRALTAIGVPTEAIGELKTAIAEEEKEGKKPSIRGRVGQWLATFLGQVAQKSAPIAADEVVKALANYLGPTN